MAIDAARMARITEAWQAFFQSATSAVDYVGKANYRERVREAHQTLDRAADAFETKLLNILDGKPDTPAPAPKTAAELAARIRAVRDQIAHNRDELRSLIEEAEALLESCEEAREGVDNAIDALSKYA